jgi:uncharacterized protein (DUF433 family)
MFDRIARNADVLNGKPVIKGTRISVELVLEWIASGATVRDIVRQYPTLTTDDVEQAVQFAAANLRNDVFLTATVTA